MYSAGKTTQFKTHQPDEMHYYCKFFWKSIFLHQVLNHVQWGFQSTWVLPSVKELDNIRAMPQGPMSEWKHSFTSHSVKLCWSEMSTTPLDVLRRFTYMRSTAFWIGSPKSILCSFKEQGNPCCAGDIPGTSHPPRLRIILSFLVPVPIQLPHHWGSRHMLLSSPQPLVRSQTACEEHHPGLPGFHKSLHLLHWGRDLNNSLLASSSKLVLPYMKEMSRIEESMDTN